MLRYPEICYKEALMTLKWWKSYDMEHVLPGGWWFGEKHIRERVKDNAYSISSLKEIKIRLDVFDDDDYVHFPIEEFRLNRQQFRMTSRAAIAWVLNMSLQW